jgi:hypothetical protein
MRSVDQLNSASIYRWIQVLLSNFASPCLGVADGNGNGDGGGDEESDTIPRDRLHSMSIFKPPTSEITLFQFFNFSIFHSFTVSLTLFVLNSSYVRSTVILVTL